MPKVARILTVLSLTVFAGCSTPSEAQLPPAFLLERPDELPRPNVVTTEDVIRRGLDAESRYDQLAHRYNILIDWILPDPT